MHVDGFDQLTKQQVADSINSALLEPLEEYRLPHGITKLPLSDNDPEFLQVSEHEVYKVLSQLNPAKAGGPDGILNWVLKHYADLLSFPVTAVLNASFKCQRLPSVYKMADISPLPK